MSMNPLRWIGLLCVEEGEYGGVVDGLDCGDGVEANAFVGGVQADVVDAKSGGGGDSQSCEVVADVRRAHHRQRGEGSDPVGVSSRTKPIKAESGTQLASAYTAAQRAAGSDPGRASSP